MCVCETEGEKQINTSISCFDVEKTCSGIEPAASQREREREREREKERVENLSTFFDRERERDNIRQIDKKLYMNIKNNVTPINPATYGGSLVNPYLKILDLAKLFVADAPIKKNTKKIVLPPLRSLVGPKTAHGLNG